MKRGCEREREEKENVRMAMAYGDFFYFNGRGCMGEGKKDKRKIKEEKRYWREIMCRELRVC